MQLTNISILTTISTLSEIGSPCETDDNCNGKIPSSVCRNKVCACANGYVPNSLNLACLPGEYQIVCGLNGDVGL
jgi:hypothetical protein